MNLETEVEIVNGVLVIHEVVSTPTDTERGEVKTRDRLMGFGKKKAKAIVANIEAIKKFAEE